MLICRKICFAAIYAVLAQNLFCCDLRTFVWRKIYSEIVRVEKKGQISGMTIGTDCFPMVFTISEPIFGDDFLWKTQTQSIFKTCPNLRQIVCLSVLWLTNSQ